MAPVEYTEVVEGTGYDAVLSVSLSFNEVPVKTYSIEFSISGVYYQGYAEDVLVVYDQSLAFP